MYFVPPIVGQRSYLRTLLTVVKGPKSFEDLRTYNGITFETFQKACTAPMPRPQHNWDERGTNQLVAEQLDYNPIADSAVNLK